MTSFILFKNYRTIIPPSQYITKKTLKQQVMELESVYSDFRVFYNKINLMPQIDFRNGIYQGEVKDKIPNGHGFFFSIDLTFIIAYWEDGIINGPTIIIYPSGSVFYGNIGRSHQNDISVIEMARDKMKAYFINNQERTDIAVTFPLLQKILKIDAKTVQVIAELPLSPQNHPQHYKQIQAALNVSQMQIPTINVINYFDANFKEKADIYQSFALTSTGEPIHFLGQQLQGIGIKLRPQAIFGKQRIIEAGVLTKQNQLSGIGYRSHVVVKQTLIQQGVFHLKQAINLYPLHQKRPTKCISVFLSHLKRSLFFYDQFLHLPEIKSIKQLITKLQSNSLFQIKRENAHRILEDPINDDAIMSQIQRSRRQRRDQLQKTQINQSRTALANSKQINPLIYSREVIKTIKEEIHRSIDKKRSSKSRSNGHINSYVKQSSPTRVRVINQQSPVKENKYMIESVQRLKRKDSGSISTKKSPPKKIDNVIVREDKKLVEVSKRTKYNDFSNIQIKPKKSIERSQYEGKIRRKSPAPILKTPQKTKKQASPKKKITFINQLQNEDLQRLQYEQKINRDKLQASRTNWRNRASPDKKRKQVFTQNIFDQR